MEENRDNKQQNFGIHNMGNNMENVNEKKQGVPEVHHNIQQTTQGIHPILKHEGEHHKHPDHISFDEKTIAEHDKLRGTRQIIDDPKTPFPGGVKSHPENLIDQLNEKLQTETSLPAAAIHAKKTDFEEKRKKHYNEMEMVKKFQEEHKGEKLE